MTLHPVLARTPPRLLRLALTLPKYEGIRHLIREALAWQRFGRLSWLIHRPSS